MQSHAQALAHASCRQEMQFIMVFYVMKIAAQIVVPSDFFQLATIKNPSLFLYFLMFRTQMNGFVF